MNLDLLFYPQSIAIIGASSEEKAVGNDIVENLVKQGYQGKIYPVNPKIELLHGLKTYQSVEDLPDSIDLVVLAVPAKIVIPEINKAAKKGAKVALVISAGFKEVGNVELEKQLAKTCEDLHITLVGPNCLGVINPEHKMNASFATLMPPAGDIAFLSQSGALCTAVLDYAGDLGIGFSKFLSIGNKAALQEIDLIKYLHQDSKTKVICIYAESLNNAPELIETLRDLNRSSNPKPIIILKSGKTTAGSGAIASHTGSLSSEDSSYEALFNQAGIIRAKSISELFDFAQVFSMNQAQIIEKVAIITNAGGPGVLATDSVIENGLKMADLTQNTVDKLHSFLPSAASVHNPIDVLGDASSLIYEQTLATVIQDQNTDAVIILLTPQSMTEPEKTAEAVVQIRQTNNKPIIVSLMGKASVATGVEVLREHKIANTSFPEPAAAALAAFAKFSKWSQEKNETFLNYQDVDRTRVAAIFDKKKSQNMKFLPEAEALEVMRAYHFPLLKSFVARNADEALKMMEELDGQVAMKIVSSDILHKSDVGGVSLNVTKKNILDEAKTMLQRVKKNKPEARLEGILLMEMAPKGLELILGVSKNSLGTMLMLGLGGIYVEVFKDVNFVFTPVTKADVLKMINSLRSSQLFDGVRGQSAINKDLIIEIVGRLAQLVKDFPEIVELDINPLLVTSNEVRVLDARIMIE